ncbi:MAG: hypothetical protein Q9162_007608 [Coniocarpon cinnabarinum]
MSRQLAQKDQFVKLIVGAGQASAGPPIGPALGSRGVKSIDFCKEFNALTAHMNPGTPVPALITVRPDRSFHFQLRTPPTSSLLLTAAGVEPGKGGRRRGANAPGRTPAITTTPSLAQNLSPQGAGERPGKSSSWTKDPNQGENVGKGVQIMVAKDAGGDKNVGHGGGIVQVGEVSLKHIYAIAEIKAQENRLAALGMKAIVKSILGQTRSCGVGVVP